MSALETMIAEAATRGLLGLTIHKTQDGNWQAATTRDKLGWQVTIDADQITAMRRALAAFTVSVLPTDNGSVEDIFS